MDIRPILWTRWRELFVVCLLALCALVLFVIGRSSCTPAGFVQAAATLIAVCAALFVKQVTDWIRSPHLELTYVHGDDYCDTPVLRGVVNGQPIEADSYYFSVRIMNSGRAVAENVEVYAANLLKNSDSGWELIRRYSLNLKWAYRGTNRLDKLLPGMERFCNIGHIIDPIERKKFLNEDLPGHDGDAVLSLDLEATPNHLIHLLEKGKYQLVIGVVAANHPIRWKIVDIDLTGKWIPRNAPEMRRDGIVISLAEAQASTPTDVDSTKRPRV